MVDLKRGEIWVVNLDSTIGHEIKKSRPALIIQNDIGNKYNLTTIIAPLTSKKLFKIYPFEVLLTKKDSGLVKDSKILFDQIRAIDKSRLKNKLGVLNNETMKKVDEALKISLGLE